MPRIAVASYDTEQPPAERRQSLRYGLQDVVSELVELGEAPEDIQDEFDNALELAIDEHGNGS